MNSRQSRHDKEFYQLEGDISFWKLIDKTKFLSPLSDKIKQS